MDVLAFGLRNNRLWWLSRCCDVVFDFYVFDVTKNNCVSVDFHSDGLLFQIALYNSFIIFFQLSNFFRPTTEPSITHAKPRIISPDGNVVRVNDVGTREIVTEKETSF